MRRERLRRVLLGLLTLWSPLFTVWLVVWFVRSRLVALALGGATLTQGEVEPLLVGGVLVVVLLLFTLVALAVTTSVYALHILRNPCLTERGKLVWSVVNVTLGPFAMPWYWYVYYWRRRGER